MFAESKKNKTELPTGLTNRILPNTKLKGDIISESDIRIDGELEGSVKTKGKLVIGKTGYVSGKAESVNADIEGKFNGTLKVDEVLSLKATAFIEGEVVIGKLAVEPGAAFNATCTMKGHAVKSLKNDSEKAERSA